MADDSSGNGTDDRESGAGDTGGTASDPVIDDGRPGGRDDQLPADTVATGDDRPDPDRIPIDLSGPVTDRDSTGVDSDNPGDGSDEGDEYGPEPSSAPIRPGDPDLEHAVFVLLGAIAMVLVIVRVVSIPLG